MLTQRQTSSAPSPPPPFPPTFSPPLPTQNNSNQAAVWFYLDKDGNQLGPVDVQTLAKVCMCLYVCVYMCVWAFLGLGTPRPQATTIHTHTQTYTCPLVSCSKRRQDHLCMHYIHKNTHSPMDALGINITLHTDRHTLMHLTYTLRTRTRTHSHARTWRAKAFEAGEVDGLTMVWHAELEGGWKQLAEARVCVVLGLWSGGMDRLCCVLNTVLYCG